MKSNSFKKLNILDDFILHLKKLVWRLPFKYLNTLHLKFFFIKNFFNTVQKHGLLKVVVVVIELNKLYFNVWI